MQLVDDGVKTVRTICSGLRPGVLDDLGLAAAIEWQAGEFASRNGIPCQVSVPLVDLHHDGDRATATFRIFQECLDEPTDKPLHDLLSDREHEVMKMIAAGVPLTEIGERLHVSVKTVSSYRARIMEKMQMSSNSELTRYALTHGLIE